MYQPSQTMPVENYSCVQPSTQQKTFTENNICRFSIPFNSIPFFDPHSSYLQVLAECNGTDKFELNGNSAVIIKYIRLSVNGIVLEEVDEFNQLAHIYNSYGHDDSSRAHESVFTLDSSDDFTPGLMGNQSVSVAGGQRKVKLILPLKECGIFSGLEVVPLMAFGNNLDVELRFAPDKEVIKTYNRNGESALNNNRTKLECSNTIGAGATITSCELALPYKGFTSVGDLPFQVGERILFKNLDGSAITGIAAEERQITAIARAQTTATTDNPNAITITCAATSAQGTGAPIVGFLIEKVKDTADNATPTASMTYSNVEWYLQKVVPPANYVSSLTKQLQSPQGFQFDIHTWTTYKSQLLTGVKSQTIEIPAYQSRAKSVLVVLRKGNQSITYNVVNANGTFYDFKGQYDGLKDYQWQVNNGLRVPTRAVNLAVEQGLFQHIPAEHLIQITQALGASNVGVRSIKQSRDNMILGRQLSKYGGTTNLNSAMRVYLNYNLDTQPTIVLQPISFVNHINRVAVNSQGLQVFN